MRERPLTYKEKKYAADHHGLVYKFLREKKLSEDEFYDVIIFDYLKAVKDYISKPNLQKYAFTTIAWQKMRRACSNYHRAATRQKRSANTISIHACHSGDGPALEELLPSGKEQMQDLEIRLLLHDLANCVSKQQMDMVRLKASGYTVRDIARQQRIPIKRVRKLLNEVHSILKKLLYEK